MKKKIYISLMTLGLFVALAVIPVQAQFQNSITVSIPFAFVVGEETMPAGDYTLKPASNNGLYSKLLIRSRDGHTAMIISTGVVQAKEYQKEARLTFNRYGNQYFLSQVWTPETNYGRQLSKPGIEASIAKSGAQKNTVSIAVPKHEG
jgi:hypothetical protein